MNSSPERRSPGSSGRELAVGRAPRTSCIITTKSSYFSRSIASARGPRRSLRFPGANRIRPLAPFILRASDPARPFPFRPFRYALLPLLLFSFRPRASLLSPRGPAARGDRCFEYLKYFSFSRARAAPRLFRPRVQFMSARRARPRPSFFIRFCF